MFIEDVLSLSDTTELNYQWRISYNLAQKILKIVYSPRLCSVFSTLDILLQSAAQSEVSLQSSFFFAI